MGTYAPDAATATCTECPEDTYAWIAGATACVRCVNGIPEACPNGDCPSVESSPGECPCDTCGCVARQTRTGLLGWHCIFLLSDAISTGAQPTTGSNRLVVWLLANHCLLLACLHSPLHT